MPASPRPAPSSGGSHPGGRGFRRLWNSPFGGSALFFTSAISNAIAGALATQVFGSVSPIPAVGFALTVAGGSLAAIRRPRWTGWDQRRKRLVALLGATILVNGILFYLALDRLPLGTTVTIEFLGPIGVAVFHGDRTRDYFAALLALVGVGMVSGASVGAEPLGVVFALASGALWALYMSLSARVGFYPRLGDSIAIALGVAGLLALPAAIVACAQVQSTNDVLLLLGTAVTGRAIPHTVEIVGMQKLAPGAAGILFSSIPIFAAVSGVVLLGQPFGAVQIAGLLLVFGASAAVLQDAARSDLEIDRNYLSGP